MGSNSIYVDSLTKTYSQFTKCLSSGDSRAKTASFCDKLAQKMEETELSSPKTAQNTALSKADMTMDEYKEYIRDTISNIPMSPSQSGWHWQIQITDAGFEAMKNDPEYEAFVLKTIRSNFSFTDHFCSQNYSILHFGATAEEFSGESISGGGPFSEKEESFWERRAKRREKLQEQLEEMLDNKALAKRLAKNEHYARLLEGKTGSEAIVIPQTLMPSVLDILESMEE